jgi:hypothetical protein
MVLTGKKSYQFSSDWETDETSPDEPGETFSRDLGAGRHITS